MIQLAGVTKTFGQHDAVTDLDLNIDPGRTVGFVGANGAGKTTTIRLIMGFLRPTVGSVRLMGYDMNNPKEAQSVRSRIGFVPDGDGLDPVLTGQKLLKQLTDLQNAPPVDRDKIIDALQLSERDLMRPIGRLSRGTRQKINLIQGLQHRPELLILDEPTEGLDPFAKRALFELLQQAKSRGATIFFSSHVLGEVEAICHEVALIKQGQLVDVFRLAHVGEAKVHNVQLRLHKEKNDGRLLHFLTERLEAVPWASSLDEKVLHEDAHIISFRATKLSPLLQLLSQVPVAEVTVSPLSLEERVMSHYR
ncbi:MAG: ATP-binding cassette domain-containing protein [Chloroflexota bacterium]